MHPRTMKLRVFCVLFTLLFVGGCGTSGSLVKLPSQNHQGVNFVSLYSNNALSCEQPEINCYRFDYSSISTFRESITDHAEHWKLDSPQSALTTLVRSQAFDPNIDSINTVGLLIERNPEYIFAFGQYIERENNPREWLFIAELAFIRSWHSTLRNDSG